MSILGIGAGLVQQKIEQLGIPAKVVKVEVEPLPAAVRKIVENRISMKQCYSNSLLTVEEMREQHRRSLRMPPPKEAPEPCYVLGYWYSASKHLPSPDDCFLFAHAWVRSATGSYYDPTRELVVDKMDASDSIDEYYPLIELSWRDLIVGRLLKIQGGNATPPSLEDVHAAISRGVYFKENPWELA